MARRHTHTHTHPTPSHIQRVQMRLIWTITCVQSSCVRMRRAIPGGPSSSMVHCLTQWNISLIKSNGKAVPIQALKAQRRRRDTAQLINLGAIWRQVVNIQPPTASPQEITPVPIKQETGWTSPSPSWPSGEKNLLSSSRFKLRTVQYVAWSLHRLRFPCL